MYENKKYVYRRTLIQINHISVYANKTYGITALGNVGADRLKPLNLWLNTILRAIYEANQGTSAASLYASHGFFDLQYKHIYRCVKENYLRKNQIRIDADNRFVLRMKTYDTRQCLLKSI